MVRTFVGPHLRLLTLLLLVCAPTYCLGQEIGEILINGSAIDLAEGSEWVSEDAVIEVKDPGGSTRLSMSVEPDSGLVTLTPSSGFTVTVSEADSAYGAQQIAIGYAIKKFKIETGQAENLPGEDMVVLKLCCDYDIELGLEDVFLLPLVYKLVRKWPWSWFFPPKRTLTVLIEAV